MGKEILRGVPGLVFKQAEIEIVSDRRARFVASSAEPDRYGDVIEVEGWELENFRLNPVVLFGHNSRELPIGGVTEVGIEGDALVAEIEFSTEELNPFAERVWKNVEAKRLRAVSVGFLPLERPTARISEEEEFLGYRFASQELVELSVVPVPAHAGALLMNGFGPDVDDLAALELIERGHTSPAEPRVVSDSTRRARTHVDLLAARGRALTHKHPSTGGQS